MGYTVSESIALEFKKRYDVDYATIRNVPMLSNVFALQPSSEKFILFQGAVNEASGFEYLIPALQKEVPYKLVICGDGNFYATIENIDKENQLEEQIELLKGMLLPEALVPLAQQATIGIGLAEKEGLNQYLCTSQ